MMTKYTIRDAAKNLKISRQRLNQLINLMKIRPYTVKIAGVPYLVRYLSGAQLALIRKRQAQNSKYKSTSSDAQINPH